MEQFSNFINQNFNNVVYTNIPTYSTHSTLIKKYINDVVSEYPEYQNIIEALICFPVQKWATITREKLNIAPENIETILEYQLDDYFGINNYKFLNKQKESLKISNKALDYIEKSLTNYKVLMSAHGYNSHDTSKYIMTTHYKMDLIDYCRENNDNYLKIIEPLIKEYSDLDDDIQFAYHNAPILLRLKGAIKDNKSTNQMNYERVVEILDNCIKSLDTYYVQDKKIIKVAMYYSEGLKEAQIAIRMNKSRTFVRNMQKEAINAISYIIWGYTTHNIICNCKENV